MKFLILIFMFAFAGTSEEPNVSRIRDLYEEALFKKDKAEELISYVDKTKSTPLTEGYKGSAKMLLARYSYNPLNKYKYFNDGKLLLEEAIKKDSISSELRYLRFSFQTNAPSFLGYNTCIQKDKFFLLDGIRNISDADLKNKITAVLKNSKYLSKDEKQKL